MKPIKLTMRGFISYKKEIVIDFRKLYDSRVFVISGDTGSGKTTIFDAISFALFGQISRSDVTDKNLRSDFLTGKDPYSYVRLEFEVDSKIYEIERIPKQVAKKSKENQNINTSVALYDITDEKVLLSEKVKESNQKVNEIIGLNKDQLKKVMLLAQGEFSDFLKANSNEKASLLGHIFKTSKYKDIQDKLKEKSAESSKSLDNLDKKLEELISKDKILAKNIDKDLIIGHDFEKISSIIEDNYKSLADKKAILDKKRLNMSDKKDVLFSKRSDKINENEQIDKYQNLQKDLDRLTEKKDSYDRLKKDLEMAKRAEKISPYYIEIENIKDESSKRIEDIEANEDYLTRLREINLSLADEKEKIPSLEKELQDINVSLVKDEENKKKLKDFREIEKSYLNLEKSFAENEKDRKDLEENKDEIGKLKDLKAVIIDEISILEKDFSNKKIDLAKLDNKLEILKNDIDLAKKNESLEADIDDLKEKKKSQEKILSKLEEAYKKALENKRNIEIANFIDEINREGICPVCGSSHPEKIEKKLIEDLDFEKIRDELESARSDMKILENNLENKKGNLVKDLKDLASLEKDKENIEREKKDLEKSIANIEDDLEEKTGEKNLKGTKIKELEDRNSLLGEKISALSYDPEEFERLKISYLSQKDDFYTLDEYILDRSLKEKQEKIESIKEKIRSINDAFNENEKEITSRETRIKTDKKELERLKEKKEEKTSNFNSLLKESFKKLDEFIKYSKLYKDLIKKEDEIEDFFDRLREITISLDNLAIFKDKEKNNIAEIDDKIGELKLELESLANEISDLKHFMTNLDFNKKSVAEIKDSYTGKKSEAEILRKLARIADGSLGKVKGREKIDFESFVLSYYFEKVLAYSNKRLSYLSNGQFQMYRKKDADDLRTKSGLDIEIFDANTGKMRPASTLSGGESFLASLSLALGLSDEISAENGGVKIDTLFIDEGFGTLSDDYLQNAIRIIENLSYENKFIGLISHVKELKDSIDAKILISYDKVDGSSLEIIS